MFNIGVEAGLKKEYLFAAVTSMIFVLCFVIFTFAYSVDRSPDVGVRIIYYGFPLQWLKTTTSTLWIVPTEYSVLWFELFVDVIFALAVSLAISFIALRGRLHEKQATQ
jgi:hypothetical protein